MPLTFAVIVGTVALYGLLAPVAARGLGLASGEPQGILILGAHRLARDLAAALRRAGVEVRLIAGEVGDVTDARLAGLPAAFANVFSRSALERLDLGELGSFMALTPDDVVNRLAADRFLRSFGRRNVYQLAPGPARTAAQRTDEHPRARHLFGEDLGYLDLWRRVSEGFEVRATRLGDSFGLGEWQEQHGPEAVPLVLVGSGGRPEPFAADQRPRPRPGDTLVGLVPAGTPPTHAGTG